MGTAESRERGLAEPTDACGCAWIWDAQRVPGVHTPTLTDTGKGHLCPGSPVPPGATGKHCLVLHSHRWLLEEGGALTCTSRGFNPPPRFHCKSNDGTSCVIYPAQTAAITQRQRVCDTTAPGAVPNPAIPDQATQKSLPIS